VLEDALVALAGLVVVRVGAGAAGERAGGEEGQGGGAESVAGVHAEVPWAIRDW
jgi:hypothetical protein